MRSRGAWSRFLAFLFHIVPKVGPFRALAFHAPTPATQKLFMDGFVKSLTLYREQLGSISAKDAPALANTNFDTGSPSRFGDYKMADEACGKLLIKLQDHKFEGVDADLRRNLLEYYGSATPADPKEAEALTLLRMQPAQ